MAVAAPRPPLHHRPPVALLALALAGCAGAPSPPAVAPLPAAAETAAPAPAPPSSVAEAGLPPLLRDLDLTPAQMDEALRLNADLARAGEPVVGAANDLARSVAGAARRCKGETPFIEMDAARVVRVSEDLRAHAIDSVQRIHHLLTPAQRRKVSDRLVEGDDWAKRERRNASRTRDLAPVLELSTVQMMSLLVKAGILWASFADRVEPWRVHYRTAITDFARDDFDARHEPVAAAPAVALIVEFVRTGLRQIIPLLEPKQCEALGQLIDEKIDEQAARTAERAAARARALEQR